jgi:hypothetical protein
VATAVLADGNNLNYHDGHMGCFPKNSKTSYFAGEIAYFAGEMAEGEKGVLCYFARDCLPQNSIP